MTAPTILADAAQAPSPIRSAAETVRPSIKALVALALGPSLGYVLADAVVGWSELSMLPSITLLGTGGPRRDPARRSTALLLRTGSEAVLIDAGRGVVHGLGEADVDFC